MKVLKLPSVLKQLKSVNEEISYRDCVKGPGFSMGVISFKPRAKRDGKEILHADKDVVCHVLRGRGHLQVNGRCVALEPGVICHIPKGTPHDFAAIRKELVLFYSLIKTA